MILAATTLATATPMIAEKAEASTPTPNTITALAKAPAQPTLDILNYPIVITNKGVNAFQVKGLIPVPDNASKKVYFTQKPDPKKPTRMIKEFPTCLCEGTTYYLSAKAPGIFNIPVTVPSLVRVPQSSSTPLSRVQSVKPLGVTPSLLDEFVSLYDSMRTDSNLLVAAQSEAATANAQAQTNRTRLAEAQADETSIESQLADLRRQYDEAQSALASIDVVTYEKAAAYVASFNALITSTRSPSDKLSALKALDRQHSTLPENPNLDDLSDRIPTLHHDVDTAIDTHNQQVYDDRINADNTTVDQWFTAEAKETLKASFDSISDLTTLTGPQLFEIFESAEMRTKYADLIPKLDALYQAEAVLPGLRSDFAGIVARNETPYYIPGELNGEESKFSSFYYRLQVEKE
jgi:hypothetical protein